MTTRNTNPPWATPARVARNIRVWMKEETVSQGSWDIGNGQPAEETRYQYGVQRLARARKAANDTSCQMSCRLLPLEASCSVVLCLVWKPSCSSRSNLRLLTLLNVLIKQLSSCAKLTYGSLEQSHSGFLSWLMCGHHALLHADM
jgi:hypothetical protein